jgi:hypothetical protein
MIPKLTPPALTPYTEWKPGRMTVPEAFAWLNEKLETFATETIARHRAEGADEETLAVLSAHLLRRRAEILEQFFAPVIETRH